MNKDIIVGIADFDIVISPNNIITIGLGSCVGISLYCKKSKMVGLIHIMLPNSEKFKNNSNKFKFADTAIPIAIDMMIKKGAIKSKITAKIAGGAQMFKGENQKFNSDIGSRNVRAVESALSKSEISILGREIGGNKGRTMLVDSQTGVVTIKSLGINIIEF